LSFASHLFFWECALLDFPHQLLINPGMTQPIVQKAKMIGFHEVIVDLILPRKVHYPAKICACFAAGRDDPPWEFEWTMI
jgi:hypothetical protein